MSYLFRSLCLTIGLLVAALPAQAADYWNPYVGAGAGSFIIDAGLGGKNAFGGYGMVGNDFTPNVGVEVRFGATGKTSGTVTVPQGTICGRGQECSAPLVINPAPSPASISVDWFVAYLLKLQYPFTNGFRVYGVVGGTTLKSKFAFNAVLPGGITTVHATTTTLSYGGGFDYGLGNQWRVGVDATVYSNKATTTPGANFSGLDVWGITATARYGF